MRATSHAGVEQVTEHISLVGVAALLAGGLALVMMLGYLLKRPPLTTATKLWLFMALGALPGFTAMTTTVEGLERTTQRSFCGSCHVMERHVSDASNPSSNSLAARHGRNPHFGDKNCYTCHASYGMYGYPMTKLNGLRHVWHYYTGGYRELSVDQAVDKIGLYQPYQNLSCMQCHSGTLHTWKNIGEHTALGADLLAERVSCASAGCHGYAHPFSKPKEAPSQ